MRYRTDEQGRKRVTLIRGDGIGPEVIDGAVRVLAAVGAPIAWEERAAGAQAFRAGIASGVPEETRSSLRETGVALKGPLETPVGYGEKSANVTLRKVFETYANVRPVKEFAGVDTPFRGRGIDLVIVRENVEDLYAGIEHMQTPEVAQCLKLMSRRGCERVVRRAFELAVEEGRPVVHCATKANIMKLTEGLMKRTFEAVAKEFPQIRAEHIIVDNCAHQLVRAPEAFSVIVTSNMNGDILSDLASGLIGGLGFAPGANLGDDIAIFEAVHGSAPTIAGKGIANPVATLLSATMLLRHLDEDGRAAQVEAAVARALADGIHTADVAGGASVSTSAFLDAVIARLDGATVDPPRPRRPASTPPPRRSEIRPAAGDREWVGVDVFVEAEATPEEVGSAIEALAVGTPLRLKMISNRGTKVYPANGGLTDCVDHWRCRFVRREERTALRDGDVFQLLAQIATRYRWMHLEKLELLNGAPGFTRAQGEEA